MSTLQAETTNRKRGGAQASSPSSVDPEELLDAVETAKLLHVKVETLTAWRSKKCGPPYLKVGRTCFYQRAALSTWLAQQIVRPGA
jgi:Helix-turn-helix domain